MTTPAPLRELEARLRGLLADLPAGRPVTITLPCDLPLQPAGLRHCDRGVLWKARDRDLLRLAAGWIPLAEAAGGERFERLDAARSRLRRRWLHIDPDGARATPSLFCGFAFDPDDPCRSRFAGLPNSLLALPEILIECRNDGAWLHLSAASVPADPGHLVDHWIYRLRALVPETGVAPSHRRESGPPLRSISETPEAVWRARVGAALAEIDGGGLQKVVLSRSTRLPLDGRSRLAAVLTRLASDMGSEGTAYAVRHGGQTLVGLSPECLVRCEAGRVHIEAVGGTTERHREPERDARQAARLRSDAKLLHEHRLVVEDVRARLAPLCDRVFHPSSPAELALAEVRHLYTPIEARVSGEISLLTLAAALHPTAATGGTPREAALDWLRRHGEGRRGWYTGALGWITPEGDGELTVVLRCGILGQHEARLYAGAGIVAGSDPDEEWRETEWKLRTLARMLVTEADIRIDDADRLRAEG